MVYTSVTVGTHNKVGACVHVTGRNSCYPILYIQYNYCQEAEHTCKELNSEKRKKILHVFKGPIQQIVINFLTEYS